MILMAGMWVLAIAALGAAVLVFRRGQRKAVEDAISGRLAEALSQPMGTAAPRVAAPVPSKRYTRVVTAVQQIFARAGVSVTQTQLSMLMLGLAGVGLAVSLRLGPVAGLTTTVLTGIAIYLYLFRRWRSRIQQMKAQMPLFLDQVIRALDIGRNLDSAISSATRELAMPLREVMRRVGTRIELGEDLADAVTDAARLYALAELHLFAMAVRVNRQYGGQIRDTLMSIVRMIEQQDRAQRELKALTGETRVTAFVLGGLPTALAAYIMFVNPDYMAGMWESPSGRYVLIGGCIWQLIGVGLLWKMMRRF